ncbi:hypothetical protein NIES2101_00275 [Calothrix sp. HK-06]|nr:hypothetical protein NIES2101_00275 [Calothrix sp. HK-06]
MPTRLFLCNLKVYADIKKDIAQAKLKFATKQPVTDYWTCGNVTSIQKGDVAYFLRVGDSQRGIFASGVILRPPAFKTVQYRWDTVVNDFNKPLLISELLQRPEFSGANFYVRGSGYKLAEEYTSALNTEWQQYVNSFGVRA